MRALPVLAMFSCSAVAGTANLTVTAPTQNTDGTAITLQLTFKFYGAVQGQAKTVLATVGTPAYTHSTAPNGVTYCYQVTAVAGGQESAPTAEVCKAMPAAIPNPPGGLTVVVTAPTAYRMRQSVDGYELVAIGTVPVGTPCTASKSVDGFSPVPRAAVVKASKLDTLPLVVFAQCG